MNKTGRWALFGGAAAVLAGVVGAAAYVWNEKSLEQPDYRVVEADGAIELRDYPELLVAETVAEGSQREALSRGFQRLADYIFAKQRGGEAIAMTAPVLSARAEKIAMTAPVLNSGGDGRWRTRFVMPAKYQANTLPPPPADVAISVEPARRVAALRFSGSSRPDVLAEREAELRAWIAARGLNAGAVDYAFYNSPFVPGPLRRNEVLIEIV